MRVLVQIRQPPGRPLSGFGPRVSGLEHAAQVSAGRSFVLDEAYAPQVTAPPGRRSRAGRGLVSFADIARLIPTVVSHEGLSAGRAALATRSSLAKLRFPAARRGGKVLESYVVRGEIDPLDCARLAEHSDVAGVFSDPRISGYHLKIDSPAIGTSTEVAGALGVQALVAAGMNGQGVDVAVVDGGVNTEHLRAQGHPAATDSRRSWTPDGVGYGPGEHPLDHLGMHGTMCAFAVGIAAPASTLLDCSLLRASAEDLDAHLSDAITCYAELREGRAAADSGRPMVISNSWGLTDRTGDHLMNALGPYGDDPRHPFNELVDTLIDEGIDVVFAAGNAGQPYPEYPWPKGQPSIVGANSLASVLCVGGVDLTRRRAGYSSQGPGAISVEKPDVMAYTHFSGSLARGDDKPDVGTSTAAPLAAGVVAALRSVVPADHLTPGVLVRLLRVSAQRRSHRLWDADYGSGIIDPVSLLALLGEQP